MCHVGVAHWQKWQSWGACTVTCGTGVRVKARMCVSRQPEISCHGSSMHTEMCKIPCNAVYQRPGDEGPQCLLTFKKSFCKAHISQTQPFLASFHANRKKNSLSFLFIYRF